MQLPVLGCKRITSMRTLCAKWHRLKTLGIEMLFPLIPRYRPRFSSPLSFSLFGAFASMLQLHSHRLPSICHRGNKFSPSRRQPNSSIFSPSKKSHLLIALSMQSEAPKFVYSVWGLPPEDEVAPRLRELMGALRSAFGGPRFEPHVTVVGAIELTEEEALKRFRAACDGLRAYTATVDRVATGTFFYQCVYLLLHPTAEVNSDVQLKLKLF